MNSPSFDQQRAASYLSAGSMAYVDDLYEKYLQDPLSVTEEWRQVFAALPLVNGATQDVSHQAIIAEFARAKKSAAVQQVTAPDQDKVTALIQAYRLYGHLQANIDPLGMLLRPMPNALDTAWYGLSAKDNKTYVVETLAGNSLQNVSSIVDTLKETYCGSIGFEYMHISQPEIVLWFQKRIESTRGKRPYSPEEKRKLLQNLIAADGLERYLGTRYVGQKRFSLEGGDAFIPLMNALIHRSANLNVQEIVIGMAHRGRLNVLVNVLGKAPDQLFQEFEGKMKSEGTGDVKYHMGFSSDLRTDTGAVVHVSLAFNPSHLEIIAPVVQGSVRSRLCKRDDLAHKEKVMPIVVHGDAAFAGQGVVMETFNLSQVRGYSTGGTVHIVINNQVGFTTSDPQDARSTLYCTDVAKMVEAPIFHVNGDDPEAVLYATELALDFRQTFHRDVVIDLVCYRRHGHNEADEPALTQPLMYKTVKAMRPLREIYAERLLKEQVVNAAEVSEWVENYRQRLDSGEPVVSLVQEDYPGKIANDWGPYLKSQWFDPVDTTLTPETVQRLAQCLQTLPKDFTVHSVLARLLQEREKMTTGEIPMNWGYAETLAFARILDAGQGVRLSGQDSGRGTFAHRHAVLHALDSDKTYIPLTKTASDPRRSFTVIDSTLSEEAVLAFEYGYACSEPKDLVLWEAQFGDFANGAQVVIDQFISSGEQKWGRLCGLVMLLPHGYEGQGPEHSSARLERYMQLCAQQNMQVCTPTTPAQIFHLLSRQQLRPFRKPLIVMTPKSLLRHKLAVSSLEEIYHGGFQLVIPEVDPIEPAQVKRLVLCCGKVYYDLLQKRRELNLTKVAIVRIEQLYPFPSEDLMKVLQTYAHVKDIVWCQEEPQNQGVWFASQHHMVDCLSRTQTLRYVGRSFAASPAAGSLALHQKQQEQLIQDALL
ncbi:MAG: 2-oxoglutarate dehydrogenase E1 component [Legionellaceae bacterium]|nr:2-oxoglutarate dehydrogenase E1 component [Legionellaceae bacterium]